MDKVSYALGISLGNNLMGSGITALQYADLVQGIQDVLEHKQTQISYQEAKQVLNKFFSELQAKINEKNTIEGKKFLAENAKRLGVVSLPSGLQYQIIKAGNGPLPKSTDTVKVHYHGTLIDGTVFDSSVQRGEPAVFGVTQVIAGWVEALQIMPVGSKWKLFIPSHLAYGERGAGASIAPNSTLIFEVELLGIE